MQILAEHSKPYIIDSLLSPVVIKYSWTFNAQHLDFMLKPIAYLEETTGPAVLARINGTEFWIPSNWYILVADADTYQIETIGISACSSMNYTAFSFSPDEVNLRLLDITIIDFSEEISVVHPMIAKGTMMMHPVGPAPRSDRFNERHLAVGIGPFDLYKQIGNKLVGDIM